MRSAFGFGGQKCSANSRVYVERPVHDELVRLLVAKTESISIGDPLVRENWLGPIIDQRASIAISRRSVRRGAGRVLIGGERLSDGDKSRGFYVEPTVVGGLPADHNVFKDEFFAPLTAVHAVDSLDEALTLANDTVYGLTAGVYSEDTGEVQQFLDRIQGRRPVREPPSRRDHRCMAGHPGHSAAGRAAARRARPGCPCTTSRNSCASSHTRSSTSGPLLLPRGAGRCGPQLSRISSVPSKTTRSGFFSSPEIIR